MGEVPFSNVGNPRGDFVIINLSLDMLGFTRT